MNGSRSVHPPALVLSFGLLASACSPADLFVHTSGRLSVSAADCAVGSPPPLPLAGYVRAGGLADAMMIGRTGVELRNGAAHIVAEGVSEISPSRNGVRLVSTDRLEVRTQERTTQCPAPADARVDAVYTNGTSHWIGVWSDRGALLRTDSACTAWVHEHAFPDAEVIAIRETAGRIWAVAMTPTGVTVVASRGKASSTWHTESWQIRFRSLAFGVDSLLISTVDGARLFADSDNGSSTLVLPRTDLWAVCFNDTQSPEFLLRDGSHYSILRAPTLEPEPLGTLGAEVPEAEVSWAGCQLGRWFASIDGVMRELNQDRSPVLLHGGVPEPLMRVAPKCGTEEWFVSYSRDVAPRQWAFSDGGWAPLPTYPDYGPYFDSRRGAPFWLEFLRNERSFELDENGPTGDTWPMPPLEFSLPQLPSEAGAAATGTELLVHRGGQRGCQISVRGAAEIRRCQPGAVVTFSPFESSSWSESTSSGASLTRDSGGTWVHHPSDGGTLIPIAPGEFVWRDIDRATTTLWVVSASSQTNFCVVAQDLNGLSVAERDSARVSKLPGGRLLGVARNLIFTAEGTTLRTLDASLPNCGLTSP